MRVFFIGLLATLLRLLSALKVDREVKYEPTTETKAEIIAKYSTVNNDAEHIRAEQFFEKHKGDDEYLNLRKAAKVTYEQVLPCIRSTWMMSDRDGDGFKNWQLPDDAEEHFEHLKNVTARFREAPVHEYSGYEGPWIENIFIRDFMDKPLSYFNGLIPLFIQFIDMQILRGRHFDNIASVLNQELRAGVIYLAVSQGDVGLGHIGTAHPNILVLAAGGYGHVPIPLVKGIKDYVEPPIDFAYTNDVTFIGNIKQQGSLRPAMFDEIRAAAAEEKDDTKALSTLFSSHTDDWEKSMQDTRFNLAPRGYGRSSFRFSETIQMGRIPVFLWDDTPWIPYQGTAIGIETYGFQRGLHEQKEQTVPPEAAHNYPEFSHGAEATQADVSLKSLVRELEQVKQDKDLQKKLHDAVKEVRYHFTYPGVVHAIEKFIADPFDIRGKGFATGKDGNYLRCTLHPHEERCCDETKGDTYALSVHPYDGSFHKAEE